MRILVTGASGFLGSHIAERAKAKGHDVVCLVRGTSDVSFLKSLGVTFREGSMEDAESLKRSVADVDAVIHSAGLVKAKTRADFDRVHVQGTAALADALIESGPGRKFIHISTAAVMGGSQKGRPHRESDPENPATDYAHSKLMAERELDRRKDALSIAILRPPAIYGPRDQELLAFFQMVRRTGVAFRLGGSLRENSMVFGPDCADAALVALEREWPSARRYFIADGVTYTYEDMAHAIAAAYGKTLLGAPSIPAPIVRGAAWASGLVGKLRDRAVMFNSDKLGELLLPYFTIDASRANTELGWTAKTMFAEGAKVTADAYRKAGVD